MRPDLPAGTVTFLFTDIEGSTRLLHELGPEAFADALAEHRRILRTAFGAQGGVEVDTQGDAFFVAFPTADGALAAAAAARDALAAGPILVRMAIHTGHPHLGAEGYIGADVHRGARIGAAGHGGQVLVSATTVALVGTDGLRDLGEHRLKDFPEPISIYQLGDERFPPLKTISNTNLPRPASTFVGREAEVQAVAALLQDGARLVTLTGPGGSGKTRLGIEAAASLVPDFKAGVFWVGLAPLRDPALVTETISQVIGAKEGLATHIAEREMLLLLDNLEQVVGSAPELASLVEACPNLRLLITSRERLRVRGEVEYPVLPLADPEAVDLFCARARVDADDAVRQLCRALDNLPLAIELAAARVSVLTPAQILERLSGRLDLLKGGRDADPRQQTLRATIEWSHDLLSPDEQRLFARLAVFAGGATLEAIEQVAAADLDTLQSLVDKSLVRHADDRFVMLETIREFAIERLTASGEADDLRRRHAEHFLALAEEAEPHLRRESESWLDRLEGDHDNLRAAFDWFDQSGENDLVLRLAAAVWWFWSLRSHVGEGRRRLEGALRNDTKMTAARASALNGAADLAVDGGDPATARRWAQEALAVNGMLGDAWGSAYATLYIGFATEDLGDIAAAREFFDDSFRAFRDLDDELYTLLARRTLAGTSYQLGDLARARALYEDNLRDARALADHSIEVHSLGALAMIAVDEGRAAEAAARLREAHLIHVERGRSDIQTATDLCRSAYVLALTGRPIIAAKLLSWAEAQYHESGSKPRPFLVHILDAARAAIRAQLDEAALARAQEQGRGLTADEVLGMALATE